MSDSIAPEVQRLQGQAVLLRIFIGERDMHQGRNLYAVIVEEAKVAQMAGATVLTGFLGYGSQSIVHHASPFRLSQDLPVLIEIVDTEEKIQAFLPRLQALVDGGGLITEEKVEVLHYQPHASAE